MTKEPPAHADRLARQRLDARVRQAGGAPERALHGAGRAGPGDRAGVGGPEGRADRRDAVRRPALDRRAAGARGVRLGARRLPRLDHGLRDDRRGGRARSASCAATRSRCCRSAATTWPTTSRTGSSSAAARARCCRASSTSTGSARTRRRALAVARLRRERARARVGLPPLRRRGRGAATRRSGACRRRAG